MSEHLAASPMQHRLGDGYAAFREQIARRIAGLRPPLFATSTDTKALMGALLEQLPAEARQHYTCHACRKFVERYGGLVHLTPDGASTLAVWPEVCDVPQFFQGAVLAMHMAVQRSSVCGVWYGKENVWGEPVTGPWEHLGCQVVPPDLLYRHAAITPAQAMAARVEDFAMLSRALRAFSLPVVEQALRVLRSDQLYRGDRVLSVAEWLAGVHQRVAGLHNRRLRHNVLWHVVATAPAGFCHVQASMLGTLLDDIAVGLPFDGLARRFREKMHPLQYRRPTAPPSSGTVAQAERLITLMGAAGSLARRFARLADLCPIWVPSTTDAPLDTTAPSGMFAHLQTKSSQQTTLHVVDIPPRVMTWERWRHTILPLAHRVEYWVPDAPMDYAAMVAAVDHTAPPLLQWENGVSWYIYHKQSHAHDWNLQAGVWCPLTAIVLHPAVWNDHDSAQRTSYRQAFLLLSGARDLRYRVGGSFFPELLRSEYHGIRAVLEAYARDAVIQGDKDDDAACGLMVSGTAHLWQGVVVRVNGTDAYCLDRWE